MRALTVQSRRSKLDQVQIDVGDAARLLDASVALMTDCLAGHPKAARYDGHDSVTTPLWCEVHECDHRRCVTDGLACGGTPVTGSDPTGNAAMSPDVAAAALAAVDRAIGELARAADRLAVELTAWSPPSQAMQRPNPASVVAPAGWCTNCWLDDRKHEPVGIRPGGTAPYYAGLCEWCGRFKAVHGYLPPLALLRIRHSASPRVSLRDIARSRPVRRE